MSRLGMGAVVAAVLIAGCTGNRLEEEWLITLEQLQGLDLEIADSFPADGVDGITNRIEPYVLYNRPLTGEERQGASALITDLNSGVELTPARDSDSDGMGVYYRPADNPPGSAATGWTSCRGPAQPRST